MSLLSLIRRCALLVATMLVLTGAAAAAHAHDDESGRGHADPACAFCATAGQTAEPAGRPATAPPVRPRLFAVADSPRCAPADVPSDLARGRAPPR